MRENDAFYAGFLHGQTMGEATALEADAHLRALGIDTSSANVDLFRNGSEDGAAGDTWRLNGGR